MSNGYRDNAKGRDAPRAPAELQCWLLDGDERRWMRLVFVKIFAVIGASVMCLAGGSPGWSVFFLALGAIWIGRDVAGRKGALLVLRVDKDRLCVERGKMASIDVPLAKLEDVRLDTKTSSKELTVSRADGVNSVFGMGSGHSIDVDVSRIELVTTSEVLLLHQDFLSHLRCNENAREIRRFLRTQGWAPVSEREEEEPPVKKKKRRS